MSILWIIRIIIVLGLFGSVIFFSRILKNREKHEDLLSNRSLNAIFVVTYNLFCYLSVGLPSDPNVFPTPLIFQESIIIIGFPIVGIIIFAVCIFILYFTVKSRSSLGFEDPSQGLITSGVYQYFRHPIYLGISLISLAIPLILLNFDGFIILPFIFLANILQAKFEEIYDIGVRFKETYDEYKKKTRLFGPISFWLGFIGIIALLILIALL